MKYNKVIILLLLLIVTLSLCRRGGRGGRRGGRRGWMVRAMLPVHHRHLIALNNHIRQLRLLAKTNPLAKRKLRKLRHKRRRLVRRAKKLKKMQPKPVVVAPTPVPPVVAPKPVPPKQARKLRRRNRRMNRKMRKFMRKMKKNKKHNKKKMMKKLKKLQKLPQDKLKPALLVSRQKLMIEAKKLRGVLGRLLQGKCKIPKKLKKKNLKKKKRAIRKAKRLRRKQRRLRRKQRKLRRKQRKAARKAKKLQIKLAQPVVVAKPKPKKGRKLRRRQRKLRRMRRKLMRKLKKSKGKKSKKAKKLRRKLRKLRRRSKKLRRQRRLRKIMPTQQGIPIPAGGNSQSFALVPVTDFSLVKNCPANTKSSKKVGDQIFVATKKNMNIIFRESPCTGNVIQQLPYGTKMTVKGFYPECACGFVWLQVDVNGKLGYVMNKLTRKVVATCPDNEPLGKFAIGANVKTILTTPLKKAGQCANPTVLKQLAVGEVGKVEKEYLGCICNKRSIKINVNGQKGWVDQSALVLA